MPALPDHAAALAQAARSMHTIYSLDEALMAITLAAQVSVPGIDHAGISTIDSTGQIVTRAATDDVVHRLDALQYSLGEGPCVDAMTEARVITAPDIANDERWPRYVAEAVRTTGLQAQLALRLYVDENGVMGGLNLYSTQSTHLHETSTAVAELFAAHASIALGSAREIHHLKTALQSRTVIGQAVGVLMERYGMNEDRAFAFLTRASSHGNVKLSAVAQELVDQANHSPRGRGGDRGANGATNQYTDRDR